MTDPNRPELIQISIGAIAKMVEFDMSHPGKETAGLLIGEEKDGVVYVDDVRFGKQVGNAVHVEVSDEELAMAAIEISEREDGKVIVGWIHTHPSLSAFLSPTDIRTQSHYQALMPNAIAIVVDPVKYAESQNIDDLDLKAFRVVNGGAQQFRYLITQSVEFGLNTYLFGEAPSILGPKDRRYVIPVPSRKQIEKVRILLEESGDGLGAQDLKALNSWLSLVEAIESGDIKEVPIEVEQLFSDLDASLGQVETHLEDIKYAIENKQAAKVLNVILGIITIGFIPLFFLLH